ncbi:uncharacterized protein At4g26485 [Amborella trichopoda]|uniref:uncharacterized protein At4g26485 n=1 Tax=Amborella trichopoda TaxID=13333 RepID=UPI0009BF9951|nr:uncharacterized protein At4g26485 [Amborella trichopoda]|eukprot:XP_011628310.2 uncharacterized protein At4g26485 [Amborella trichopoda]
MLKEQFFDRIVFNFPHAGFHGKEDENWVVNHQTLHARNTRSGGLQTENKWVVVAMEGETRVADVKKIKHYWSSHKILLVGEGDFSFSLSLARAFGSGANMVATSHDTREMLETKHETAVGNVEEIEKLGCLVLHGIDASEMSENEVLKPMKFDRIVFNFPHAGYHTRWEHQKYQIKLHRRVVKGFFKNAGLMLEKNGETHITHKIAYPFCKWKVEKLAQKSGLILKEECIFSREDYPGYINKRGDGRRSNGTFPVGKCSTFKFKIANEDWMKN